jgi:predicted enzyme related to lactoylglutathione lyase
MNNGEAGVAWWNTGWTDCGSRLIGRCGAAIGLSLVATLAGAQPVPAEAPLSATAGVRLNVPDLPKALKFYVDLLGFEAIPGAPAGVAVIRARNGKRLFLVQSATVRAYAPEEARPSLTLQVNDLRAAWDKLVAQGISVLSKEPRKEGVGFALTFTDPFGTPISMMHQTIVKTEPFAEPRIYNQGLYLREMAAARSFAGRLGLMELSAKYLPLDVPLGYADKSFGFMLHAREWVVPSNGRDADNAPLVLVLQTADVTATAARLKEAGVPLKPAKALTGAGVSHFLIAPDGIPVQVVDAADAVAGGRGP